MIKSLESPTKVVGCALDGAAVYPSLIGRRVFITGGATGIGAMLVNQFAAQGAKVGLIDLDEESGQALVSNIMNKSQHKPWFRSVDVCDLDALKAAIDDFATANGGLDVLINNVANDDREAVLDVTPASWRNCMAVNLDSAFFATQTAVRHMQPHKRGTIVTLSSINALWGPPDMPGYVAAKSGLLGLGKSLARQLGPDNIRVNTVLPGWVITQRQLEKWLTPEAEAAWMEEVALKRRIMPEDIGSLVLFLSADDSRAITGQYFIADGGRL